MPKYAAEISRLLAPYYSEMSLMLAATLLVIYGDLINKHIKRVLAPCHFIIRISLFVALCAFGYGLLTLHGAPIIAQLFLLLPWQYQGLAYILAFLFMGILAERRRYI
ncbi:DUF3392 family protein [Agaribacter flavus]|uniref:DUF3392 family protein n=1 Tax=Agaribacter flavus TaxID=1902781 RepID=A0ABV7FNE0_9ALTE